MASPAALLLEAKAEFDAWEASGKSLSFQVGSRVYVKRFKPKQLWCQCGTRAVRSGRCSECRWKERSTRYPPCACGKPYFARSLCRPCYYKEINKVRKPAKRKPKPDGPCECGRYAVTLGGQCNTCYKRDESRRRRLRKKVEKLMLLLENKALLTLTVQRPRGRRMPRITHGTYATYKKYKCRCATCKEAHAAFWQDYRIRNPDYRKEKEYRLDYKRRTMPRRLAERLARRLAS
jgi:hypothetical protein